MFILKSPDINVNLTTRYMFRYHCELVPGIFHGYFVYNTDVHKCFTRQCAYFHMPVVKSELSKFSIRYRGAVVWNEILKLGIDTSTSEVAFMKSVKSCINDLKLCVSYNDLYCKEQAILAPKAKQCYCFCDCIFTLMAMVYHSGNGYLIKRCGAPCFSPMTINV